MRERQLKDLHAWRTDDLIAHLKELEQWLGRNRLFELMGNERSLDAKADSSRAPLRIALKAIAYDAKAEAEEVHYRESLRAVRRRGADRDRAAQESEDDPSFRMYALRQRARVNETPDRAVILGDPAAARHAGSAPRRSARLASRARSWKPERRCRRT